MISFVTTPDALYLNEMPDCVERRFRMLNSLSCFSAGVSDAHDAGYGMTSFFTIMKFFSASGAIPTACSIMLSTGSVLSTFGLLCCACNAPSANAYVQITVAILFIKSPREQFVRILHIDDTV